MYSTCLFCHHSLGANESVASFRVGRRLAFDPAKGRLWVVCHRCEKWNLSPLEERWEAIEQCERLFRDARTRVSTDQIGLARLREGLELVRIGSPLRPEFAAWRYGDQFGRRRRKAQLLVLGAAATSVGLLTVGPVVGGIAAFAYPAWEASLWMRQAWMRHRRILEVRDHEDGPLIVHGGDVKHSRLVPSEGSDGWALELLSGRKKRIVRLEGTAARRAAMLVVPHLTPFGANRRETREAVAFIEEAGDPDRYLRWLVQHRKERGLDLRGYGWGPDEPARAVTLEYQGLVTCLAVEMAVNEETERRALAGELVELAETWRDAEEIAAIADGLTVPSTVDEQLQALKTD